MINKLLLAIAALFIFGIGLLAYLVVPLVATPTFVIKNEAGETVEVTAQWRNKVKQLGNIQPGSELVFEIKDEAAMEFRAVFPNGRVVHSGPAVYFTSGTVTEATVTAASIEVLTVR